MRVALLSTGRMEFVGLPRALSRLFPAHDFYAIAKRPPDEPFDGFTSTRLPLPQRDGRTTSLEKVVEAMAGHLVPGRRGDPPDYLVVLDDLELANADQPKVVISEVREATRRHLSRLGEPLRERVRGALAARASFHLAVVMAEAWLFADPEGPAKVGAPLARLPPKIVADVDPEALVTDDPLYDVDDASTCSTWLSLSPRATKSKRRAQKPEWLRAERQRHPKSYLAWLCRDPLAKKCSTYRETSKRPDIRTGAGALANLDWEAVLSHPSRCQFLRAMVEDIADALGESFPGPHGAISSPLTSRHNLPEDPVLRNV